MFLFTFFPLICTTILLAINNTTTYDLYIGTKNEFINEKNLFFYIIELPENLSEQDIPFLIIKPEENKKVPRYKFDLIELDKDELNELINEYKKDNDNYNNNLAFNFKSCNTFYKVTIPIEESKTYIIDKFKKDYLDGINIFSYSKKLQFNKGSCIYEIDPISSFYI